MKLLKACFAAFVMGFMSHLSKPVIDSVFQENGLNRLASHSAGSMLLWFVGFFVWRAISDADLNPEDEWTITGGLTMLSFGIGNLLSWMAFDAEVRHYLTGIK